MVIPHLGWFWSLGLSSLVTANAGRPSIETGGSKGTESLSKEYGFDPMRLRRGARRGRSSWKARMANPPAKATTRGLPMSTSCRSMRSCLNGGKGFHSSKLYSGSSITFSVTFKGLVPTICNRKYMSYVTCQLIIFVFCLQGSFLLHSLYEIKPKLVRPLATDLSQSGSHLDFKVGWGT